MRSTVEINNLFNVVALRYRRLIERYESFKNDAAIAWVKDSAELDRFDASTLMVAAQIRECELQMDIISWFEGRKPRYRDKGNSYLDEQMLELLAIPTNKQLL
ncbi:hypothetical protein GCM10027592_29240 [Spirosoma flavus]